MEWMKIFKPKKQKETDPAKMMRTFEEIAEKTGKKAFYRGGVGKKNRSK